MNKPLEAFEKRVLLDFLQKRRYALGGLAGFKKPAKPPRAYLRFFKKSSKSRFSNAPSGLFIFDSASATREGHA